MMCHDVATKPEGVVGTFVHVTVTCPQTLTSGVTVGTGSVSGAPFTPGPLTDGFAASELGPDPLGLMSEPLRPSVQAAINGVAARARMAT